MSIAISGSSITFPDQTQMSTATGGSFRNRIINGDMRIDQRNAGASVTPANGAYTLDRWSYYSTQASKFTVQRNAGSVTPPAGYTNYMGITSTSAFSIAASDYFIMTQAIEGFNVSDLSFGTANAKSITISFWVYSSLTGTFGGVIENSSQTRAYPFSYTISSANTWEQKSVTIAGDTTGTWVTDNGLGLWLMFSLGTGSTYAGTAGAWVGSQKLGVTGAVSVVGTNGATFYITGVQLEQGSTATEFERRPIGVELELCQRYYQGPLFYIGSIRAINGSAVFAQTTVPVSPKMRSAPTISVSNNVGGVNGQPSSTQYSHTVLFESATQASMGTIGQFDYTLSAEL